LSSAAPRPSCRGAAPFPIGAGVRRSLNQTLDSGARLHQGGSCARGTGSLKSPQLELCEPQRLSMSGNSTPFARRSLAAPSRIRPDRRRHERRAVTRLGRCLRCDGGFALPIEAAHPKRAKLAAPPRLARQPRRHGRWARAASAAHRAGEQSSRRGELGRLHRNPGPAQERYRGDARGTPRARDAP
jgi:hypothetical protein